MTVAQVLSKFVRPNMKQHLYTLIMKKTFNWYGLPAYRAIQVRRYGRGEYGITPYNWLRGDYILQNILKFYRAL